VLLLWFVELKLQIRHRLRYSCARPGQLRKGSRLAHRPPPQIIGPCSWNARPRRGFHPVRTSHLGFPSARM